MKEYSPNSLRMKSSSIWNISQAFRHAHTLKGLAATLDLTNISDILIPMTEKLRAGESEGIQDLFDQLKVQYKLICDLITEHKAR